MDIIFVTQEPKKRNSDITSIKAAINAISHIANNQTNNLDYSLIAGIKAKIVAF